MNRNWKTPTTRWLLYRALERFSCLYFPPWFLPESGNSHWKKVKSINSFHQISQPFRVAWAHGISLSILKKPTSNWVIFFGQVYIGKYSSTMVRIWGMYIVCILYYINPAVKLIFCNPNVTWIRNQPSAMR